MNTPVSFSLSATEDVRAACDWLDEIERGFGEQLISEIDRVATSIGEHPGIYEQVHRGCRRAVLRKFDYVLIYRVHGGAIEVLALLHCRLDPAVALSRSGG